MLRIIKNRYGAHFNLDSNILNTFKKHPNVLCIQVYMGNKVTYQVRKITDQEKNDLEKYLNPRGKTVYIHAPLIANLSNKNDLIHINSIEVISSLLKSVQGLPMAVVLHIGERGELIKHINKLITDNILTQGKKHYLLLEPSGFQSGCTWEELEELSNELDHNYVGLCLDTSHMFASGMCQFNTIESIDMMFQKCESLLKIDLIHINDSKVPFLSYKERHEALGKGMIWGSEETRPILDYFIKQCFIRRIDLISETPDSVHDLDLLSKM